MELLSFLIETIPPSLNTGVLIVVDFVIRVFGLPGYDQILAESLHSACVHNKSQQFRFQDFEICSLLPLKLLRSSHSDTHH
jgi:hypothetical protein